MKLFALFESAAGYTLFKVLEHEEVGELLPAVQESVEDYARFSKILKLSAFFPFTSPEDALQNINDVSEGILNEELKNFLEMNLPAKKEGKKSKFTVAVGHSSMATALSEGMELSCMCNDTSAELIRGIRLHFEALMSAYLKSGDLQKAQLGLGHSYSRCKVKFNVNRSDNMIIQSISLLDQMDKDLNLFSMRLKEWYSWHFPELSKIVSDNLMFAKLVLAIRNKTDLKDADLERIRDVTLDESLAKQIVEAAKLSMGADYSEVDMMNVVSYATRVQSLAEYRHKLHLYLMERMDGVAPNLSALIGELVGARLISHAGSLTNLSKYPASTVQILGAEKALFRALKTRGNTPKYGLLYHSTYIGRAGPKDKGRIARYLANKCSMASRIDAYSDVQTNKFGEVLKNQCEERLKFYASGAVPRKNIDVMHEITEELRGVMTKTPSKTQPDVEMAEPVEEKKEKKSKKKSEDSEEKEEKKEKKEKKSKKRDVEEVAEPEPVAAPVEEKKEKKHKKHKHDE